MNKKIIVIMIALSFMLGVNFNAKSATFPDNDRLVDGAQSATITLKAQKPYIFGMSAFFANIPK